MGGVPVSATGSRWQNADMTRPQSGEARYRGEYSGTSRWHRVSSRAIASPAAPARFVAAAGEADRFMVGSRRWRRGCVR